MILSLEEQSFHSNLIGGNFFNSIYEILKLIYVFRALHTIKTCRINRLSCSSNSGCAKFFVQFRIICFNIKILCISFLVINKKKKKRLLVILIDYDSRSLFQVKQR
jgi:hypothetical protein